MILEVRPFSAIDCVEIFQANPFPSSVVEFGDMALVARGLASGHGFTAFADGKVVASSGIIPIGIVGVGEAWLLATALIKKYPIFAFKTVNRMFEDMVSTLNLRRVQTVVKLGCEDDCVWVERLGFEFEGILRSYCKSGDFIRYARIFGGGHGT